MADTKTVSLSEAALFKGTTYGPGENVEVPESFPEDTEARIQAKRARRGMSPQSPPGASGSGVEQTEDVVGPLGTLQVPSDPAQRTNDGANTGVNKAQETDYESKNKDELLALVEKRELDVEGTGSDGAILKADLVKALEADDKKAAK